MPGRVDAMLFDMKSCGQNPNVSNLLNVRENLLACRREKSEKNVKKIKMTPPYPLWEISDLSYYKYACYCIVGGTCLID